MRASEVIKTKTILQKEIIFIWKYQIGKTATEIGKSLFLVSSSTL